MSEIRLIDANALIDDYRVCGANCKDYRDCSGHVVMCDSARFRQAINDQPTVEVEPIKTAHWEFKEKDREMLVVRGMIMMIIMIIIVHAAVLRLEKR